MRMLVAAVIALSVVACTKKVEPTTPDGSLPAVAVEEPPTIGPLPDFKPTEVQPETIIVCCETVPDAGIPTPEVK